MCAMHRSMGRLKMRVRLPDDWGKLCRWHWQHSEGHADLRRSPWGEARSLVELLGQLSHHLSSRDPGFPARHAPPQQSHICWGGTQCLFWRQGADVSPTSVTVGGVAEGCLTCVEGSISVFPLAELKSPAGETEAGSWERSRLSGKNAMLGDQPDPGALWLCGWCQTENL